VGRQKEAEQLRKTTPSARSEETERCAYVGDALIDTSGNSDMAWEHNGATAELVEEGKKVSTELADIEVEIGQLKIELQEMHGEKERLMRELGPAERVEREIKPVGLVFDGFEDETGTRDAAWDVDAWLLDT